MDDRRFERLEGIMERGIGDSMNDGSSRRASVLRLGFEV